MNKPYLSKENQAWTDRLRVFMGWNPYGGRLQKILEVSWIELSRQSKGYPLCRNVWLWWQPISHMPSTTRWFSKREIRFMGDRAGGWRKSLEKRTSESWYWIGLITTCLTEVISRWLVTDIGMQPLNCWNAVRSLLIWISISAMYYFSFQTPFTQQLHCKYVVGYRSILFFWKEARHWRKLYQWRATGYLLQQGNSTSQFPEINQAPRQKKQPEEELQPKREKRLIMVS